MCNIIIPDFPQSEDIEYPVTCVGITVQVRDAYGRASDYSIFVRPPESATGQRYTTSESIIERYTSTDGRLGVRPVGGTNHTYPKRLTEAVSELNRWIRENIKGHL